MSALWNGVPPFGAQILGWVLVHTLWQGGILACMVALMVRLTPPSRTDLRSFWYAWGAVLLLPLSVMTGLGVARTVPSSPGGELMVSGLERGMDGPLADQVSALLASHVHVLAVFWVLGVLWQGGRLGQACLFQSRLRRQARPLQTRYLCAAVERIARALGLVNKVRVMGIESGNTPLVLGLFKPLVLLPVSLMMALPMEQLEALLAHELAHIRRHDALMNALLRGMGVLFFFNPGFLWLRRRWEEERECSCDDLALRAGVRPLNLARGLLALCERGSMSPPLSLAARGNGVLKRRIFRMMGELNMQKSSLSGIWMALLLLGGLLIPVLPLGANRNGGVGNAAPPTAVDKKKKEVPVRVEAKELRKVTGSILPAPPPPPVLEEERAPGRILPPDESVPAVMAVREALPPTEVVATDALLPAEPEEPALPLLEPGSPEMIPPPMEPEVLAVVGEPDEPPVQMDERQKKELQEKMKLLQEHLQRQEEALEKIQEHSLKTLEQKGAEREEALKRVEKQMRLREESLRKVQAAILAREGELAAVAERMQKMDGARMKKLQEHLDRVQASLQEQMDKDGEKRQRRLAEMQERLEARMKREAERWARSGVEGAEAEKRAEKALKAAAAAMERCDALNRERLQERMEQVRARMEAALEAAEQRHEAELRAGSQDEKERVKKVQAEHMAQMVAEQEKRRLEEKKDKR